MKFFFTLTLATIFSSAFSQAIDPIAKAIEIQNLPISSEKIDYKADHSGLFEYVPDFLLKASEEDLTRIFSASNFERFSVTGVGTVYEKKKGKEISRNSKCIGQRIASGNAMRSFQNLFKRYRKRTLNCLKLILRIHLSISRKLESFGRLALVLIIGLLQLRTAKISSGSGLAPTMNMKE